MKKLFLLIVPIFLLTGCVFSGDQDQQIKDMGKQIKQLDDQVYFLENENDRLQLQLQKYQNVEESTFEADTKLEKNTSKSTESEAVLKPNTSNHLICGGESNFLCPNKYFCEKESDDPKDTGICVLEEVEAAPALDPVAKSEFENLLSLDTSALSTYTSSLYSFQIAYPKYWYYSGFGATSGSLFTTGFARERLDASAATIDATILLEVFSGFPAKAKSITRDKVIYEFELDSEKYIRLTAPRSMDEMLKQMKNSLKAL